VDRLGDYRLRKKLAVGGMGEVYLAEKIGPEGFVKPMVLKCVRPQLSTDRGFVQLFLDEARLAALLNHPNIAQVYDFGIVDDVYFIAMEYVPGYTLDDLRRKQASLGQRMPLQHIANIASQACQGLHYAHALTDGRGESLGLVHRDVSPHNLIVSIDGTVKLVDFGIAKARAGLTRVQAKGAVGKLGYMSPEQSRGEVVDGRSDVFSLGVCLWELTTNERLWPPDLESAPDYRADAPLRAVDELRAEVPRQFSHIIATALAVDPRERFPSAREMHLALERFQAAMTHYAGQAALAQYISELVEGRVPSSGSFPIPHDATLDGEPGAASGVIDTSRSSASRRIPASWDDAKPRPASSPSQRASGAQEVEFLGDPGDVPELARPPLPPTPPPARGLTTPLPRRSRKLPRGPVAALAVAAVAFGAWWFADDLRRAIGAWRAAPVAAEIRAESRLSAAAGRCRVESTPPGGRVFVDGEELEHRTPLEVTLEPDVEHRVEVRLDGWRPLVRDVRVEVGERVRLDFDLVPAWASTE
jgi:serine/threonine protein kinase